MLARAVTWLNRLSCFQVILCTSLSNISPPAGAHSACWEDRPNLLLISAFNFFICCTSCSSLRRAFFSSVSFFSSLVMYVFVTDEAFEMFVGAWLTALKG